MSGMQKPARDVQCVSAAQLVAVKRRIAHCCEWSATFPPFLHRRVYDTLEGHFTTNTSKRPNELLELNRFAKKAVDLRHSHGC